MTRGRLAPARQAHPKTRFWLLTNFPNGTGVMLYHARGPQRRTTRLRCVIGVVLRKLRAVKSRWLRPVDNPMVISWATSFC